MTLNKADTCRTYILTKFKAAEWDEDAITEQMVLTPGRIVPLGGQHTRKEGLRPDVARFIRRNIPIAVLGAKASYKHAADGLAQAMRYAEMPNIKIAYSSHGHTIVEHDYLSGPERDITNFPTTDELWGRLQGSINLCWHDVARTTVCTMSGAPDRNTRGMC